MIDFERKDRYTFEDLVAIMRILRKKCPWDKEQTHDSIKRNFIEETYEVIDAIENKDDASLAEELGDVLLQVAFHTEMASEQNRFEMEDVTTGICEKLIRRHPHIFSDQKADNAEEVLQNWSEIKKQEKSQQNTGDVLKNITKHLPSLLFAYKIQKETAKVGFDFPTTEQAFLKLQEEVSELNDELKNADINGIEQECADVIFSCVNILRRYKIDPELAVMKANKKFINRYLYIENQAKLRYNRSTEELTLEEMDKLWDEYKNKNRA